MDLNEIVYLARTYMEVSGDHKFWVEEDGMIALIAAGARVIEDHEQCDGTHLTEAIYKGIHFTHTSRQPLQLFPVTNPIIH